jgi:hypothetical protein
VAEVCKTGSGERLDRLAEILTREATTRLCGKPMEDPIVAARAKLLAPQCATLAIEEYAARLGE